MVILSIFVIFTLYRNLHTKCMWPTLNCIKSKGYSLDFLFLFFSNTAKQEKRNFELYYILTMSAFFLFVMSYHNIFTHSYNEFAASIFTKAEDGK